MLRREFHPVGQGAFYSERHIDFTIVYDCGEWKNSKHSSKIVETAFPNDTVINILFISHFDYDHVSKISKLKESVTEIKKVVLPLLHKDEAMFLCNYYKILGDNEDVYVNYADAIKLIEDPESFFGDNTEIIRVESTNSYYEPSKSSISYDNLKGIIESGTEILMPTKKGYYTWIFKPYNIEFKTREKHIKSIFKKVDLDSEILTEDVEISITERKKLKDAYSKLSGGINKNSMFLYSGPEELQKYYTVYLLEKSKTESKAGCIYTGDADLNVVDLKRVFKEYWHFVGTVQIPHHGDNRSFKADNFEEGHLFCPISCGKNNSYHHPSREVVEVLSKMKNTALEVTDSNKSFKQIFSISLNDEIFKNIDFHLMAWNNYKEDWKDIVEYKILENSILNNSYYQDNFDYISDCIKHTVDKMRYVALNFF